MTLTGKESKGKRRKTKNTGEPKSRALQPGETAPEQSRLRTLRRTGVDQKVLAAQLSQRALAGNMESARLLVSLAGRGKQAAPAAKKRSGLTLAQRLALNPPWQAGANKPGASLPQPQPKPEQES